VLEHLAIPAAGEVRRERAIRMPTAYISKKLPRGNKAFCILARSNDVGIFRDREPRRLRGVPSISVRIYGAAASGRKPAHVGPLSRIRVEAETFVVSRG